VVLAEIVCNHSSTPSSSDVGLIAFVI